MAFKDLTGLEFGHLTFQKYLGNSMWECLCRCGSVAKCDASNVKNGHTKSCGCLKRANAKHRMCRTPEYNAWTNIINRCENETHPNFKDYGGRGIVICPEWRKDFRLFYAHIGPRPSNRHSVERIDNGKGYEPGNVKWATMSEQSHNTRWNHYIEIDGVRKTVVDWSRKKDIHFTTICHRIARGMSERDAVLTPARFVGRRASRAKKDA